MRQWAEFKRRSPAAKMICIDIQPYGHTQAQEREDIVNVGGFSDQVFRPDCRSGRRRHGKGPLGWRDCRHATVMSDDWAAAAFRVAAAAGGGKTRANAGRMPLRRTFSNVTVSTIPCRPRSLDGIRSENPANAGGSTLVFRVRTPAASKRVFSPNPRRRTFEDKIRRIQSISRDECQRNYMAPNHAVAGSSPAIPARAMRLSRCSSIG